MAISNGSSRYLVPGAVAVLLLILAGELAFSIRKQTQTWDEAAHIYAGYMYWTRGDFGTNPEHPPFVKLLAAVPLLKDTLNLPAPRGRYFKEIEFLSGHDFLYANDADRILFQTRMAVAILTLALALLVFLAAREMFGTGAAVISLLLFVLEPTVLAHGALVTTDAGFALFLFAAAYSFYRYLKRRTLGRLAVVTLAVGLGLATKHSGVLLIPILALLALVEWALSKSEEKVTATRRAIHLGGALAGIAAVAIVLLWGTYGFRFSARPGDQAMVPALTDTLERLNSPAESAILLGAARWRVLPEAYLYGLADVKEVAETSPSYLFRKVYAHGKWFYFPAALAVKSSIALLVLLLAVPLAFRYGARDRLLEFAFLTIPAGVYLAVAMASSLNLGIRHILPIYPFLIVLAGMAAANLARRGRTVTFAVCLVLLFDLVSSGRAYPNYIPYANELWGGPANAHKLLTDSNVDWGQQLKSVKSYLDRRGVQNCWFAYFADVVADPAYYGIRCRPLTTIASIWLQPQIDVPDQIDGPVLISAGVLSGYEFGPGELNPYEQFQKLQPSAGIDDGVFVFDGRFSIRLASALNHVTRAQRLVAEGREDEALRELQLAAKLAPRSARVQSALAYQLLSSKRTVEARSALESALMLAQSVEPGYQQWRVDELRRTLGDLDP